ncbi:ABC transporter permease [Escherichia coli]|uniref:ABC transporter permease n=1 Tax=Escherichia coli TaxID=562 RepID=A0A2X1N4D5_ECOLX|nr:ABC transporter permease [Escherichia coli]
MAGAGRHSCGGDWRRIADGRALNLLLSVVGALIIQGMNTGILLSGFPPEMNQVVKAVVVLCVLIVQSQRFISLIKGVRSHDKT